jgi:NAD(P)-dependent dehydrogenase (short-subunit alcohol dehydrogenase family)
MNNVPDRVLTTFEPIIRQTPVARTGSPLDVGTAVAFLSSGEAEWITGQTLSVNGGYATY